MRLSKILTGILASLLTTPAMAIPIYWDISYTDLFTAEEVGTGSFSYDTDNANYNNLIDDQAVTYSLDTFEFNINSVSWSLEDNLRDEDWYVSQTATGQYGLGQGSDYRFGNIENSWSWVGEGEHSDGFVMVDTSHYHENLEPTIDGYSILVVNHYYDEDVVRFPNDRVPDIGAWVPGEGSQVDGEWVATLRTSSIPAVPVPATLPLFGLGLAGLMWLSSRQRSHKSRNLNIA